MQILVYNVYMQEYAYWLNNKKDKAHTKEFMQVLWLLSQ